MLTSATGVQIEASDYGATLLSVKTPDRNGTVAEITLGYETLEEYLGTHPYFGSTIGRVGNRIANATFTLDGTTHRLATNNGRNHLHGGVHGFNRYLWDAEAFERGPSGGVIFHRLSPDGEEHYPGNLDVTVSFSLTDSGELYLEYRAETDAPTPVNLTNHSYWNLSSPPDARVAAGEPATDLDGLRSGPGGAVGDHLVQINADRYLPTDEGQIPTGELRPVDGTPFDFRSSKPVGRDIDQTEGGYDHCMVLAGSGTRFATDGAEESAPPLRDVATVTSPETGRRMEIQATTPAVQFYVGNKLGNAVGRGGLQLAPRDAMCFETQFYPDAVNHPEFPQIILRPGQTFEHRTVHRFTVVE